MIVRRLWKSTLSFWAETHVGGGSKMNDEKQKYKKTQSGWSVRGYFLRLAVFGHPTSTCESKMSRSGKVCFELSGEREGAAKNMIDRLLIPPLTHAFLVGFINSPNLRWNLSTPLSLSLRSNRDEKTCQVGLIPLELPNRKLTGAMLSEVELAPGNRINIYNT